MNSNFSPWTRMWTQPRATMRFLQLQTPHWQWWLPVWLLGIYAILKASSMNPEPNQAPWLQQILSAIVLGTLWGWAYAIVVAFALSLLGYLWQAQRNQRALRLAVVWSQLPTLLGFPIWLIQLYWFGPVTLQTMATAEPIGFRIIYGLLSLYSLLLLLMSLAEVQQISVRRSAMSIALLVFLFMALFANLAVPNA